MKNVRASHPFSVGPRLAAWVPGITLGIVFLAMTAILLVNYWPDRIDLEEGQVSSRSIMAEKRVEIINEKATEEAKKRAAAAIGQMYVYNPEAVTLGASKIEDTFVLLDQAAARIQEGGGLSDQQVDQLSIDLPVGLSHEDLKALLSINADARFVLQNGALHIFYKLMDGSVTEARLEEVRGQTEGLVSEQLSDLDQAVRGAVVRIINDAVQANQLASPEKTRQAEQRAMAEVEPVLTVVRQGAAVVREGEVVTAEQIKILEELGLYKPKLDFPRVFGVSLLVFLGLSVVFGYLYTSRADLFNTRRVLVLVGVILVATGVLCRVLIGMSVYLAPVAVASVLVTTLLERRLGILVTGFLALFVGVMTDSVAVFGVSFLTGIVGVLALSRLESRARLIPATVLLGAVNLLAVLAFELIAGSPVSGIFEAIPYGLLNGFMSGWIAIGALPMFEHFSGITTNLRLLDLSNMSEPLLQRLTLEAPGTYQHSMMVANLAEQSARAIGANALLCRVGAYYHDIGKMKRPRFFIENQMGVENPHDKLAPSLSTRIIHSHVKDGIEMGRMAKLPDVLIDFIAQHHGTNLVGYFYHQACKRSSEPVFEEDFRYPGPKPQSKETAILLLCDGIEAAARTLANPTPEKLGELVEKMFKHNLDDGQLDESGLSLRDLTIIRETLTRALQGIYHSRIEYPDAGPERQKVTQLRRKGS